LPRLPFRIFVCLAAMALAGCATYRGGASVMQLADGSYRLEGPKALTYTEVPNKVSAARICPDGYSVLDKHVDRDGESYTVIWIVDCD
jgi:hypothetical protein